MHLSGFRAIGGGHATASRVFSFLGLYSWNENFELTNQLTSDNQFQSDRKMQCIHTTSRVKIWPAAYITCQTPIVIARWLGVIILLRVRCRKKYFFLVPSERKFRKVKRTFSTPSRQPLNRFSWNLASLFSISFSQKPCRRFLFSFSDFELSSFFQRKCWWFAPLTLS